MLKKILLLSILVLPLAAKAEQLPVVNLSPPGYVDGVAVYCVKHDNSRQSIICSATDPLNVAIVAGSVSVGTVTSQATAAATPPAYTAGIQNESQTLSGGLRVQPNLGGTDLSLGQSTKAGSIPVTIASDQGALAVNLTAPIPAGTNTIGGVTLSSGTVTASNTTAVNNQGSITGPSTGAAHTVNQLFCASASADCVPIQVNVARAGGPGTGYITHVKLDKSGSTTTGAQFAVYFFSAAPTLTGLHDTSSYAFPSSVDFANYLGSASCVATNTTTDSHIEYECSLSNLGTQGLPFKAVSGQVYIDAVITVLASYTAANSEVFTLDVDTAQD